MTINWLNNLPVWNNDIQDQTLWIQQFKAMLQQQTNEILLKQHDVIYLAQATEPSQGQWETAYTAQTGKVAPPIPPYATLIWWDSNNNIMGGQYGTVSGDPTVYRREHKYPKGGTVYFGKAHLGAQVSGSTAAINTNNVNHPSLTFTLPTACMLLLTYTLSVKITAGSGQFGGNFLLDGQNVGVVYYGLAASRGIVEASWDSELIVPAIIPVLAAGQHTVQALFGTTGNVASPPTLQYGGTTSGAGNWGIRQLIVEGIAL